MTQLSTLLQTNIASNVWSTQTTSFTAATRQAYQLILSSAITITLPATPANGDHIRLIDYNQNSSTYNVTIVHNGNNIQGQAADMVIDINGISLELTFVTGQGWIISDTGNIIPPSPGYGFKNRIINGATNIAQRGASIAVPTANTDIYGGPDRFRADNSGGGQFTQSQSSLTYNGITKLTVRQTVNTAATTLTGISYWSGLRQIIEGFNSYDLVGQTVTVSFIFNTNVTGTYSLSLQDSGTNSYVTTFAATANTPTKITKTISIPTNLSIPNSTAIGVWIEIGFLNTATYQTSTLNVWQSTWLGTANTQTNWGATIGNFIELTELQLEVGSYATPFEQRPYGIELALCQRYYETGYSVFATGVYAGFSYKVDKRIGPTIAFGSHAGTITGTTPTPYGFYAVCDTLTAFSYTVSAEL